MADHRAEQIMAQVLTTLTNLATTGENVARGRYYAWPEDTKNALEIFQGGDDPLDGDARNLAYLDSWLTININAVVKLIDTLTETQLNQIRKEITIAMLATDYLGLAFVLDVMEGPTDQPELDLSEKAVARMRMQWLVKYRRSVTDPSS